MRSGVDFPKERLLEKWSLGWTSGDVESLTELWDPEYENLTFLATERDDPARSYSEVRQYYTDLLSLFVPSAWTPSEVFIDRLADDLVLLRCKVRMEYDLPEFEGEGPSFWRARVCQIWRYTEKHGWRLIHKEDSTNEFDRAVNLVGRLRRGHTPEDILEVWNIWKDFVPDAISEPPRPRES